MCSYPITFPGAISTYTILDLDYDDGILCMVTGKGNVIMARLAHHYKFISDWTKLGYTLL